MASAERTVIMALLLLLAVASGAAVAAPVKWRDTTLSAETRTRDLIPRLTQNLTQVMCTLNQQCEPLPLADGSGTLSAVYNVECLHGPATKYISTVFPTPITQAASFDFNLSQQIGHAIATTLRAGWNEQQGWPYCFAPDVNLVRDPRYGRGQETWGEDPWLVSQFGKAFVLGLQTMSSSSSAGPAQPLAGATCKHLIAYDHSQGYTDAKVDDKNLFESYLPGWEGCAGSTARAGADALSIMCSYGLFRGVPTCGSDYLLNTLMREGLEFGGSVVSDCGAVQNMCGGNWTTQTACSTKTIPEKGCHRGKCLTSECQLQCQAAAAAAAINNGMDMACGDNDMHLDVALAHNWTSVADISRALYRTVLMRMKLGMYDDPQATRWAHLKLQEQQGSAAHKSLALKMAREAVVLLQNHNSTLPISLASTQKIAVVGPLADDTACYLGERGYLGTHNATVTARGGIEALAKSAGVSVDFVAGCSAPCATGTFPSPMQFVILT